MTLSIKEISASDLADKIEAGAKLENTERIEAAKMIRAYGDRLKNLVTARAASSDVRKKFKDSKEKDYHNNNLKRNKDCDLERCSYCAKQAEKL